MKRTTQEKSIRVVCNYENISKTILKIVKKGNDFYSSIAGTEGHSSYHESGKTQIKHGKWGNENDCSHMVMREKVADVDSFKVIQTICFLNSKKVIQNNALFKKYKFKDDINEVKIDIDCDSTEDGSIIAIISGFSKNNFSYKSHITTNLDSSIFTLLKYENFTECSLNTFTAVLNYKSDAGNEVIKSNFEKIGINAKTHIPNDWAYFVHSYGETITTIFGSDFGNGPKRLFNHRPLLPIPVNADDKTHNFILHNIKDNGYFIKIDDLSFGALQVSNDRFLHLFIFKTATLKVEKIGEILLISSIKELYFYFQHGGHRIQQFKIGKNNYQIECHVGTNMHTSSYFIKLWELRP